MKLLLTLALVAFAGAQDATVYEAGNGVSLPQVTRSVGPHYTSEAMRHRIEGKVVLSAVVLTDGTVGNVTITESLDSLYGLDDNAVKATKQWQFKPGTKDGRPVAVRVSVMMTFTMSSSSKSVSPRGGRS
jgi:periplasmic protein TonB